MLTFGSIIETKTTMKTWKNKIELDGLGVCTVKELSDQEASRIRSRSKDPVMPVSTGFINLYKNGVFAGTCGVSYAERRVQNTLRSAC